MTSTIHARSVLDTPDRHVDPNLDAWFIIASALQIIAPPAV
jgi:hypothetical protein